MNLEVTSDIAGARKRPSSVDFDSSNQSPRRRGRELVTPKRVRTHETPGQRMSIPLNPAIPSEPPMKEVDDTPIINTTYASSQCNNSPPMSSLMESTETGANFKECMQVR